MTTRAGTPYQQPQTQTSPTMDPNLEALIKTMTEQFRQLNNRFDQMEERMDNLEESHMTHPDPEIPKCREFKFQIQPDLKNQTLKSSLVPYQERMP